MQFLKIISFIKGKRVIQTYLPPKPYNPWRQKLQPSFCKEFWIEGMKNFGLLFFAE